MSKNDTLEDLKRSGLSARDAQNNKITTLTPATVERLTGKKVVATKYPYLNVKGRETGFYRLRFHYSSTAFGNNSKKQRYWQPADTAPAVYFPKFTKSSWSEIAKNVEIPILITEGEKKALKACKEGLVCIGLGGVWSFKSKKRGKALLDDFFLIDWRGRETIVNYDSDLYENENVFAAMRELVKKLEKMGAHVYVRFLPVTEDGSKVGLDDYLLDHTIEDFENLQTELWSHTYELMGMNKEVCMIETFGKIYRPKYDRFISKEDFVGVAYADRRIEVEDNAGKIKTVAVPKIWLEWPLRKVYRDLVYEPGEEEEVGGNLNLWKGWGVEPKKGDIKPFTALMNYLFEDDKKMLEWVMQWIAYPFQNPGAKLSTSLVMIGPQGCGKTFLGTIIGDCYGKNFVSLMEENLHGDFNEWAVNKQFALGEEMTGTAGFHGRKRGGDNLKQIITREVCTINEKYQPIRTVKDCINYMFNSNHLDAFFLENDDRRYAIHRVERNPSGNASLYDKLNKWRIGGGPAHLLHHLLNNIDCKSFSPTTKAPLTSAKEDMIESSRSDIEQFAHDLKYYPDMVLVFSDVAIQKDLFTTSELIELYKSGSERNISEMMFVSVLKKAGFKKLRNNTPIRISRDKKQRLWAARNQDKWDEASNTEIFEEYNKATKVEREDSKVAGKKVAKKKTAKKKSNVRSIK